MALLIRRIGGFSPKDINNINSNFDNINLELRKAQGGDYAKELSALEARIVALEKGGGVTPTPTNDILSNAIKDVNNIKVGQAFDKSGVLISSNSTTVIVKPQQLPVGSYKYTSTEKTISAVVRFFNSSNVYISNDVTAWDAKDRTVVVPSDCAWIAVATLAPSNATPTVQQVQNAGMKLVKI